MGFSENLAHRNVRTQLEEFKFNSISSETFCGVRILILQICTDSESVKGAIIQLVSDRIHTGGSFLELTKIDTAILSTS